MTKFAANLTMLFNEVAFPRPLRRGRDAGFKASSTCSLTPFEGDSSPSGCSEQRSACRCCTTCPPATGRRASAASRASRIASANSSEGVGKAIDYAKALGVHAGQLPRRHRAGGRATRAGARDVRRRTCASRPTKLQRGRHQAADRADQHVRHPGLLPEPHARRRST